MSVLPALAGAAAFGAGWTLLSGRGPSSARRRPFREPADWGRTLADLAWVRRLKQGAQAAARSAAAIQEMPELFDILALGLHAGLSFDGALGLYLERYDTVLAERLGEARLSWSLGLESRADALRRVADELSSPPLLRFADAVAEALEFGVPLAATLERQSEAMRRDRRLQVEEEIERVPVKLLLPLGTLVVPAMLLAVLGPLMAQAMGSLG
ncbi:type II secretion system F family protein [Atopobiaceae bacterium 24-176]